MGVGVDQHQPRQRHPGATLYRWSSQVIEARRGIERGGERQQRIHSRFLRIEDMERRERQQDRPNKTGHAADRHCAEPIESKDVCDAENRRRQPETPFTITEQLDDGEESKIVERNNYRGRSV